MKQPERESTTLRLAFIRLALTIACGLTAAAVYGAPPTSINIHVRETEGIRRSGYPVNARIPFAKGDLKDPAHVRLMLNEREIAAQIALESRWPDDSIQWLDVDFNATIAPLEEQTFRIEYGDEVKATVAGRGLTVNETADAIQVGSIHFGKTASPLVLSVSYRQEDIGKGLNGFSVTDTSGISHELTAFDAKVVKPGPLYAVVRYAGKANVDTAYAIGFTIQAEMPSGKTWVKYTITVNDPSERVRDISFNSPIAFSATPWLWDFGTGSWTYGSFRNPADSAVLTQVVKPGGPDANSWKIENGPKGQEQPYEVAGGSRPKIAEGWGHFQDGKEVIAFGFDKFGEQPGTYTVAFDGRGQELFRFAPAQPATQHQLTIYQHYVASPTPIGAVTSPVSMLHSLTAVCDRDQYIKSSVPVPLP